MSKPTPRPWTVEKFAPFGWTIRAPLERLRHLGQGIIRCELPGEDAGANAQLIAAAPDLLEALKELVVATAEHCNEMNSLSGYLGARLSDARAAIAKAEGKS